MQSLKIFLLKKIREYLFNYYKREFEKIVEQVSLTQREHIISCIHEAEMRHVPVVIELNPLTAMGVANIKAGTKEDNEKKENPFTLVKDDEE